MNELAGTPGLSSIPCWVMLSLASYTPVPFKVGRVAFIQVTRSALLLKANSSTRQYERKAYIAFFGKTSMERGNPISSRIGLCLSNSRRARKCGIGSHLLGGNRSHSRCEAHATDDPRIHGDKLHVRQRKKRLPDRTLHRPCAMSMRTSLSKTKRCMGSLGDSMKSKRL